MDVNLILSHPGLPISAVICAYFFLKAFLTYIQHRREHNRRRQASRSNWAATSEFALPKEQNRYSEEYGVIFSEKEIDFFKKNKDNIEIIGNYKKSRGSMEINNDSKIKYKSPSAHYWTSVFSFSMFVLIILVGASFIYLAFNLPSAHYLLHKHPNMNHVLLMKKNTARISSFLYGLFIFISGFFFLFFSTDERYIIPLLKEIPDELKEIKKYPYTIQNIPKYIFIFLLTSIRKVLFFLRT